MMTEQDNIAEQARIALESLLAMMGVDSSVVPHAQPIVDIDEEPAADDSDDSIVLNIHGDDLGILIGRRGQTLACLQYIVRLIVGHQTQVWAPIVIDVEGYKQRRYSALKTFAQDMAERVRAGGAPFALEPMSPYERRIIHLALADNPDIITESIGQGEARRVVIQPKEQ